MLGGPDVMVTSWDRSGEGNRQKIRKSLSASDDAASATQIGARRKRKAFAITDTELNVMAALAIIGLNCQPTTVYNTPAATGTPSAL